MGKALKIITFVDATDERVYWSTAFFSKLSEDELQKKANEIVDKFEKIVDKFKNHGLDEWTFEDIIEELKKQNLIEEPDFDVDWYEIAV